MRFDELHRDVLKQLGDKVTPNYPHDYQTEPCECEHDWGSHFAWQGKPQCRWCPCMEYAKGERGTAAEKDVKREIERLAFTFDVEPLTRDAASVVTFQNGGAEAVAGPQETETFTDSQVKHAITAFLDFGEQTFGTAQQGYFSGSGFAARALRFHLEHLPAKETP